MGRVSIALLDMVAGEVGLGSSSEGGNTRDCQQPRRILARDLLSFGTKPGTGVGYIIYLYIVSQPTRVLPSLPV